MTSAASFAILENDWIIAVDIAPEPAPAAPQPDPPQFSDPLSCPCVLSEHPVSPCFAGCWHFTPDGGHRCENCGQPPATPQLPAPAKRVYSAEVWARAHQLFPPPHYVTLQELDAIADELSAYTQEQRAMYRT